jgi:S-adenosyl-L-methionine hydrolase (adenosine-forming)
VIRSIAPHVTVIDVVHDLPPHDVRAAGLSLVRSVQYLAPGVVLAVVDPGVGTSRRAVAIEVADGEAVLVGPDNGLLAGAVAMVGGASRAVSLTNAEYHLPAPGPTFAGRDILAPAAAHICNGVDLLELGDEVDPMSLTPGLMPLPLEEDGTLKCEVLWVDRYGNAQLNVGPEDVEAMGDPVRLEMAQGRRTAWRASTYADLKPGQLGLIVDSYGLVSIALDRRSAAEELHIAAGEGLVLSAAEEV